MHGAGARNPARQDLGPLGHERQQQLRVLVVDVVDLVRAELADLAASEHRPALTGILALLSRVRAAAAASKTLAPVHTSIPISNRSSRSSSLSPRWLSPGVR